MAADPVTPIAGLASEVTVGGTAVVVNAGDVNGGYIMNPVTPGDQNTGLDYAEPLYVNPVGAAGVEGNGTTFRIEPGGTWSFIAGQTTPTSVNAATSGHKFSVVTW